MATLTRSFSENFDQILQTIEQGVLDASATASLESQWYKKDQDGRCAVRVFERYSHAGGNRVSMSVTLFQAGEQVHLCAVTSGGSQAMFWKVNTWGEEAFLDTLRDVLRNVQ